MSRRRRDLSLLEDADGDADPLASVANLFDVAMVFAAALVVSWSAAHTSASESVDDTQRLDGLMETGARRSGSGERLGMAYRLEDGRIVYVPEAGAERAGESAGVGR